MKGAFILIVFGILLLGLSGCYTIPRHYTVVHEIVYYPPPPPDPPEHYPCPVPDPVPNPPVHNPPSKDRNPHDDKQPVRPQDSYDQRGPLQGGNNRGSGEVNIVPPVRTPERKDGGRQ